MTPAIRIREAELAIARLRFEYIDWLAKEHAGGKHVLSAVDGHAFIRDHGIAAQEVIIAEARLRGELESLRSLMDAWIGTLNDDHEEEIYTTVSKRSGDVLDEFFQWLESTDGHEIEGRLQATRERAGYSAPLPEATENADSPVSNTQEEET